MRSLVLSAALLSTAFLLGCGEQGSTSVGLDGLGPQLTVISGGGQSGVVGTELAEPLVVRVTRRRGRAPRRGQIVVFRVTSGAGSMFAGVGLSNAHGIVQDRWTLGLKTAENQEVQARAVDNSTGAPLTFGKFTATALPGPAFSLTAVGGEIFDAVAGVPEPLAVLVTDEFLNPVPGVSVSWTALFEVSGTVNPAVSTSDATGVATTEWTPGLVLPLQFIRATSGDLDQVDFLAIVSGVPTTVVSVSGDGQTVVGVGSTLADPLVVQVLDESGLPVSGVPVNWIVGNPNDAINPATVPTDINGFAQAQWTLGEPTGTHSASAGVSGFASGASFSAVLQSPGGPMMPQQRSVLRRDAP